MKIPSTEFSSENLWMSGIIDSNNIEFEFRVLKSLEEIFNNQLFMHIYKKKCKKYLSY